MERNYALVFNKVDTQPYLLQTNHLDILFWVRDYLLRRVHKDCGGGKWDLTIYHTPTNTARYMSTYDDLGLIYFPNAKVVSEKKENLD